MNFKNFKLKIENINVFQRTFAFEYNFFIWLRSAKLFSITNLILQLAKDSESIKLY